MTVSIRHAGSLLALLLAGAGLSACGTSGSSSNFKGEKKAVAETLSNLASAATAQEAGKVCSEDLAKSVTSSLTSSGKSCEKVIEPQLAEIVEPELTVESVSIKGTEASAVVKGIVSGKSKKQTVALVREGHDWKIKGLTKAG